MKQWVKTFLTIVPLILKFLLTVSIIVGIGICIYIASVESLTTNEILLLSIILTIFSILASWIIATYDNNNKIRLAAEEVKEAYTENIRMYGIKAAEKVLNLSNELEKVNLYISDALEDVDGNNVSHDAIVNTLRERMVSVMHIVNTLKSTNDTFLSDWRGVIGEELEQQFKTEAQIDNLTKNIHELLELKDTIEESRRSSTQLDEVQSKIDELENSLKDKVSSLPFNVTPVAKRPTRVLSKKPCPTCSNELKAKLRTKTNYKKVVYCDECKNFAIYTYLGDDRISIEESPSTDYLVKCPVCRKEEAVSLANHPGTIRPFTCSYCDYPISISKTKDGFNIIHPSYIKNLPAKLIEEVRKKIPDQPWGKGMHKIVAEEMGISNTVTSKIIQILISRGIYSPEPNVPVEDSNLSEEVEESLNETVV